MLKINQEFEESFKRWRDSLIELNMDMIQYVHTYKKMHDLLGTYLDQMNLASSFFQLAFRTFRTASILWISKLFHPREQSSLFAFLDFVQANLRYLTVEHKMFRTNSPATAPWIRGCSDVSAESVTFHRKRLAEVEGVVTAIATLRDKFHAHLDRAILRDRKSFVEENRFSWDEILSLTGICHDIVQFYSIAFDGESRFPVPLNFDDLENMLRPRAENDIKA